MLALIDGDVLVYQVGYTTNDVEEWIAAARLRDQIKGVLQATGATGYEIWLSDSKENWRKALFANYKANRTQPKPTHYEFLLNTLVNDWDAQVALGEEADDAMGIRQTTQNKKDGDFFISSPLDFTSIICTIDKDLQQIPGNHYNWDKQTRQFIEPSEGLYRFYYQLLVGDSGDNITVTQGLSCKGIGAKKAQQMLEGCETEDEMFTTCWYAYEKAWGEGFQERLLLTGQLIKIRQTNGEIWTFPFLPQQEGEAKPSLPTSSIPASSPSTVLTKPEKTGYLVAGQQQADMTVSDRLPSIS